MDYYKVALAKAKGGPLCLLLMGSAAKDVAAVEVKPKTKTIFLEDLPPEEIAKVVEPSGLMNMGNTCYLNSVVQCLRIIEPFREGLSLARNNNQQSQQQHQQPPAVNQHGKLLLNSLNDLYKMLDRTADPVSPTNFVLSTKMVFPQFAQTGAQGQPMQQDAEEFFSNLLTLCGATTSTMTSSSSGSTGTGSSSSNNHNNLADDIFGIVMEETLTCDETPKLVKEADDGNNNKDDVNMMSSVIEPAVVKLDHHRKLVCNIQGGHGQTTNITHIYEGIRLGLEGKIEKHSQVLGRDATWSRRQRIKKLPTVLVVQFGRFYWKETPDSQDHAGVKCKIMKKVAYGTKLDVYDFCTDSVQKVLKRSRDVEMALEEARIQDKLDGKMDIDDDDAKKKTDADGDGDVAMKDHDDGIDDDELKAALAMSLKPDEEKIDEKVKSDEMDIDIGTGSLPSHFQGHYELCAIVSHKGRNADGGHYMSWVKSQHQGDLSKKKKMENSDEYIEDWFLFNDDEVSPCTTQDILKLQGGGDYDMSYLNFYRAKKY